jgi:hypothetical protein
METGKDYEFYYPRHNLKLISGAARYLERRRIRVEQVRNLDYAPLNRITKQLNPFVRRGRTLVTGIDLDKGVERSFYLESMADVVEIVFHPSPADRCEVRMIHQEQRPDEICKVNMDLKSAEIYAETRNKFAGNSGRIARIDLSAKAFRPHSSHLQRQPVSLATCLAKSSDRAE